MNKFTPKTRTTEYLRKIKNRVQDDFPANERGDVLLLLSSSRIYEPYVDDEAFKYVARKYFPEGLDFLVGNAVRVTGDSDINYYAPHQEKDLRITYEGNIPFPITITSRTSSAMSNAITKISTISSEKEFNERVRMHFDAYELRYLRYFARSSDKQAPSYVWLPHPKYVDDFKEIVRNIVQEERAQIIERK